MAVPGPGPAEPSLTRATAVMSVGTGLSRITGFVRLAVMAWAIGGTESKLPDTYNLANSLPNMVYQLVIGEVLATVFVPIFVEYIKTRSVEETNRLARTIIGVSTAVAAVFVAITVAIAPWLIKIYTFGIEDPTTRMLQEQVGTFFLRIFMPQMIFYALGAVFTGVLNAHRRFGPPMFAPVLNNVIVTATFIIFRIKHGAGVPDLASLTLSDKWLLAGGTSAGVVAMTVALWPSIRRLHAGYSIGIPDWKHPALRRVGTLAKYSFGYVVVNQIGLWVIYALANGSSTAGGVTAYNSSWILYQLPYGIFAVSVMTFLVPKLAEHHVDGDTAAVRSDVSLGLRATAFIVLPAAAGFIALGRPIIRLLLENGVFGEASTDLFADTFVLMSIGLAAYAAFQQLMRAFYAMQDTRTPLIVNVVAIVAQVAAAIPLFALLGIPGLGLAHAISYLVGVVVGGGILRARLGGLDGPRMLRSHLLILAASAATGLLAWVVSRAVGDAVDLTSLPGRLAQVLSGVAAGVVLYGALAKLLRIQEFEPLAAAVGKVFGRRR